MGQFVVGNRSTPLHKIVRILEYVNQREVVGELELDDFMLQKCEYDRYNFRIDIREKLRENGWLGYGNGEYYIRLSGRRCVQGLSRTLPEHERPERYRSARRPDAA